MPAEAASTLAYQSWRDIVRWTCRSNDDFQERRIDSPRPILLGSPQATEDGSTDTNQDIADAAAFQVLHDLEPELDAYFRLQSGYAARIASGSFFQAWRARPQMEAPRRLRRSLQFHQTVTVFTRSATFACFSKDSRISMDFSRDSSGDTREAQPRYLPTSSSRLIGLPGLPKTLSTIRLNVRPSFILMVTRCLAPPCLIVGPLGMFIDLHFFQRRAHARRITILIAE